MCDFIFVNKRHGNTQNKISIFSLESARFVDGLTEETNAETYLSFFTASSSFFNGVRRKED